MDFHDALNDLRKANPDCIESGLQSALAAEAKAEIERLQGTGARNQYVSAVETAHRRMVDWLANGCEYAVTLDWRSVADFSSSHRAALVYCVAIAKARAAEQATA